MAGVNKVILLGNLGQDPEIRNLPNGSKVANFSIATSERYTNKDGQVVDQTEWHRIELWDNLATIAEKYLKKGNSAYVEGRIRTEEWQDKEGINRKGIKIRATALTLVGGNNNSENTNNDGAYSNRVSPAEDKKSTKTEFDLKPNDDSDDLPF
ncbi:MAG: single-stranded DNA-binding protein [Pseudarcicella sp.]|nr:single-stranded DNA-binding protein [Pseudarcicella sp.]MBP6410925.1 single-stranded DNA-binding protein [Pseudarcicella sp.]